MAKFRTTLQLTTSDEKITHKHNLFSIGSCFSENIANYLSHHLFNIYTNPFGILFHPPAIENAILRIYSNELYTEEELFYYNEKYISWDHHSSFSSTQKEKILDNINTNIETANEFLIHTNWVIITLGTAYIYKLKQLDTPVANCHKLPNTQFEKHLLSTQDIITSLENTVKLLSDICLQGVNIILALSPIRHIKDGFIENNRSKSRLLEAIHTIADRFEYCQYFPSYEFIMDDLRDYRFYKKDMLHPSEVAIEYIWDKFTHKYFDDSTQNMIKKIEKINTGLAHRPFDNNTIEYKKFVHYLIKEMQEVQKLLNKNVYIKTIEELKITNYLY